jgi:hypothetical protein
MGASAALLVVLVVLVVLVRCAAQGRGEATMPLSSALSYRQLPDEKVNRAELVQAHGHSYAFGAGATVAGLYFVPHGTGTLVGGLSAGGLSRRPGPGRVFSFGVSILAGGSVWRATGNRTRSAVLVASRCSGPRLWAPNPW